MDDGLAYLVEKPQAGADKLYIKFSLHPKQNAKKTLEQGRPVFDDVEYIEIRVPGDKESVIHRAVRDDDRNNFRAQYQAWQKGNQDAGVSGTPLSQWPGVTRAQAEELAFFHVRTVEQLADLNDGHAQKFIGIQQLKIKAKDYLAAAAGAAPAIQLREELAKRDAEINALKSQLAEAMAEMRKNKKQQQ